MEKKLRLKSACESPGHSARSCSDARDMRWGGRQSADVMRVGTALEAADASDRHAARGGKMVGAGLPGEAEAH